MGEHERIVQDLADFTYPARAAVAAEIDMVMKGGITSGVVYPLAVCELAKTRRFRNLGGSSAGGIAAAMAAAAECARDTGGFNRLAGLPLDLGENLLAMFQPSPGTKPLFRVLLAAQSKKGKAAGIVRALVAGGLPWFAAVALAIPAFLLFGVARAGGRPLRFLPYAGSLGLPLGVAGAATRLGITGKKRLEENGYGVCRGSAGSDWPTKKPAAVEPFTDWMHAKLNEIAGRDRGHVLTFGELAAADLRLEMMTTNVTHCRPLRLPFKSNVHFFCPTELRDYFPTPVVEHLVTNAQPSSSAPRNCPDHGDVLLHLPDAEKLPLLVAVRMTLSFPGLISAVPLFAVDHGVSHKPVRCWFSDGGISSNFPIHFFDSLWPRRPTFGISLGPYPPEGEKKDVYFRDPSATAQPRVRNTDSLFGFVAAMLDTLQNWSDEGQRMLPGYRDRIVEVRHSEEEGGMNLAMTREDVLSMSVRGYKAAKELDKFDFAKHRDVRFRTAMAQLDRAVLDMASKYDEELAPGVPGYRAMLKGRTATIKRCDALLSFGGRAAGAWTGGPLAPRRPDFLNDEPKPIPDLRIVAHF